MTIPWSKAEKAIAKSAFDRALKRRSQQLIDLVNNTQVSSIEEVWTLLDNLKAEQKAMQTVFDYRYSQLDMIFPRLIHEGVLTLADFEGLSQQRLDYYQQLSQFLFDH